MYSQTTPENKKTNQTEINDLAYFNKEELTEIIIPEGITHIGKRAFSKCHNLKKIVLPQSLISIDESAFSDCSNLEEITIPSNVKSISYRAFAGCSRLKKIHLPEGLENLGFATFADCHSLTEVTLPNSIKELSSQTFLNCRRLKKVTLPNSITSLPDEFFKGCHNLDMTLLSSIKKLGASVFEDCYKLSTFPENVTSFGVNCFKRCRSLTDITLNPQVVNLPNGSFEGCTKLSNITYENNDFLPIGKKCFKNCYSLTSIPTFVKYYNDSAFESCIGLTSIDITNSTIPFACFRNCKNLKQVNGQEKINCLHSFAFSGCDSLESFELLNVRMIPAEAFSNCKKLRTMKLSKFTHSIRSRAFYNCPSLVEINLPDILTNIGKQAFKFCHALTSITIPARLKYFGPEAFSYMDSLEQIYVSPFNQTFETEDHKTLFNKQLESLVLYASGCKDKTYSLENYNVKEYDGNSLIQPTKYIADYAFAGAKHLEELTICACTSDIEITAFEGCSKLKKLTIASISLFTCPTLHLKDHGRYYFHGMSKKPAFIPFETIEFTGDIVQIFPKCLENFENVTQIIFPQDNSFAIGSEAFRDCSKLASVNIQNGAHTINKYAFPKTAELIFDNGLHITGLTELSQNNDYIGEYKLFTLDDGTYYIDQNGQITTITKRQIDTSCSHSEYINKNPILYLDFMSDLIKHDLGIRELFNGILLSTMSLENRQVLFARLKKEDTFLLNALTNSHLLEEKDNITEYLLAEKRFNRVINHFEMLRRYNITSPELSNKFLIAIYDSKTLERLIASDYPTLERVLRLSNLFDPDKTNSKAADLTDTKKTHYLTTTILEKNTLEYFVELVKKYNIQDRYLFNKVFIAISDNPLLEDLFKVYDSNIKRLLKASLMDASNTTAIENLADLLSLMKISGALEAEPITRQKACTFITEKIFPETLPNNTPNNCRIVGDDIHRVFNLPCLREEFDAEFATFFLENYQQLFEIEKEKSGFIIRVYLNFREISRTSTSNKGSQRKLKVTIEKCIGYLSNVKFDGVTKETREFATLIGAWYDKNTTWLNAQRIYNESLKAPRNIFTSIIYDEKDRPHFDNAACNDLREPISPDFSYEWLPKQDYENLILGKFCNCCAHIEGAGFGIMRASMILDCVQNLVIRSETGEIVAKATLYINRKERYGVFNNVEVSFNHRNPEETELIYRAFMRGAIAFFETYNKNNPDTPLNNISIGANRNGLSSYLNTDSHPVINIQQALNYGEYNSLGRYGGYNGDWKNSQRLFLKRQ